MPWETESGEQRLRHQLAKNQLLLLLVVLTVLNVGLYLLVRSDLTNRGEQQLYRNLVDAVYQEFPETPLPEGKTHVQGVYFPEGLEEKAGMVARKAAGPGRLAVIYGPDTRVWGLSLGLPGQVLGSYQKPPANGELESFLVDEGLLIWQVIKIPLRSEHGHAVAVVGTLWNPSHELLRAMATYQLLIGLATLAAGMLLSSRLAARLVAPLEALTQVARRVAQGDFSARAPIARNEGEVERLCQVFNDMVGHVEDSLENQKRFVADASHELKTPLTSIKGMAQMLGRGAQDDPEDRELALATISREVGRMDALVKDLLELSKAEHPLKPEREAVKLAPVLEEFRQERVVVDCPAELEVLGRSEALGRVFSNLIGNALKYSDEQVEISARRRDKRVEVRVSDRGPGLTPPELKRAFERFYRADSGRCREKGGTGLGLAIVSALVTSLGGSVQLESEPGQGLTAIVDLESI